MKCECGETTKYNEKYDSYYCLKCNKWLSEKCGDDKCEFCADRPQKPSEVKI